MSSSTSNLPEGFDWVLASNGSMPPSAVVAGTDTSGDAVYVARVSNGSTTHIGKCGQHIGGAIVVRDGREQLFGDYEVLCGQSAELKWVEQTGALDLSTLGGIPFMGGTDADGAALFVSRTKNAAPATGDGEECSVGLQPGSIGTLMSGARIAYNGAEYIGNTYEVLVLAVGSVYWASSSNGDIPSNAIPAGHDSDGRGALYIARAPMRVNGFPTRQVGKAGVHLGGGAFAVGDEEIFVRDVEVLAGDPYAVRWIPYEGRFDLRFLEGFPVPAGIDADGAALFAARTQIYTAVHPGKVSESFSDGMHYGLGGKEWASKHYQVLCYK